ncbi:MAG: tripartite tricarboxylate transporter substrate-binding protein [Pseudomonadota bacterium]
MLARRSLPLLAAALPLGARAQPRWPQRPVKMVVPFAAGGIIDVLARIVAEPLGRKLGQPFVIDNVPGAGSSIGARAAARATADGYTLLFNGAAHVVIPALYPDAGFDALADFIPVSLVGDQSFLLCVHRGVPAQNVADFLAWLRTRRGEATFATTGIGAASHLAGELLKTLSGVDFTVVPYRGTPAAVTDFLAGRVDFMIDSQTLLAPYVRDGAVRALAVTTTRRSRLLPDLPTLAEAGVAGYAASSFQVLFAPRGTPGEIVTALAAAVTEVQADPEVQRRFAEAGVDILAGPAAPFVRAEAEKWLPILRASGARP